MTHRNSPTQRAQHLARLRFADVLQRLKLELAMNQRDTFRRHLNVYINALEAYLDMLTLTGRTLETDRLQGELDAVRGEIKARGMRADLRLVQN